MPVSEAKQVPYDQWPTWAACIGLLRIKDDVGVGDTVARLLGAGGDAFKEKMKAMGVPCGCDRRREEWNERYRY